ncbi:tripeptidyl peptidase a [Grosmannia clavigera kw1407]|uniref:tripeptidyl-peptidase II n=1 Tax=Grosmannia clavigera (strain kw1407 / UAMH 11150) TaxID=655863 RepID=F0X8S9_GROCL|nr:tripeptidyl peptidase a [Grosmannia clavigera kw1407]EFX05346.1 tripeptidyl peptidase a [Grosmannia clavigera kw1407]
MATEHHARTRAAVVLHTLRGSMATLALAVSSLLLLPAAEAAVISSIDTVPKGWSVAPAAKINARTSSAQVFTIALALQNIDQLESHLLSVSSPNSASYGAHEDVEGITAKYGPSDEAVQVVTAWLKSSSAVQTFSVRDGFVDVAATVDGANTLFNASYDFYTHEANAATTKLRTLSYSVPDHVAAHVALVDPGNYFGKTAAFAPRRGAPAPVPASKTARSPSLVKARGTSTTIDAACSTSITPACLKQLYNVGNYTPDASSGSRVGFGSFLNQSALYADVFTYEERNGIAAQNFTVELIANATNDQDKWTASVDEANLDVQNIIGVSHPLPVIEYITGGSPPFVADIDLPSAAENQNEPYLPYLSYLLAKSNSELPQAISNSYGDEEDSVPYNYANYTCNLIGMLGLRGITVLHSSGDMGVGAGCLAPDNTTVEFNPIYPATCPYVTAVGGTVNVSPEIAWKGSSGGFSKYFPRPSYQDKAVSEYLSDHVNASTVKYYAPYTNFSGRGFPDVSAHSVSPAYEIIYFDQPGPSGGTSAAAPVWAGIVGLLNDARLRSGKSTLGWLNPLIYTYGPSVLNDITDGYSVGCNGVNYQTDQYEPAGAGIVPGAHWNATVGWDPVTGYGTPNFEELKKVVLGL